MKKIILLFSLIIFADIVLMADHNPIVIHNSGTPNDHFEHYGFTDIPDAVFFDSDEMEIIIEADGTSLYYNVEIVSDYLNQTVISTQVSGYGDAIDVSSLPIGDYTIIITSQILNEYEGQFSI